MSLFSFFRKKKCSEKVVPSIEQEFIESEEQIPQLEESSTPQSCVLEEQPLIEETEAIQYIFDEIENEILKDYDPTLDLLHYTFPTSSLLKIYGTEEANIDEVNEVKNKIITTYQENNINIDSIKATVSAINTLYEIVIKSGTRIASVKRVREDLAFALLSPNLTIETIMEKGTIGITVPNKMPQILSLHSIINSHEFQNSEYELPLIIGKDIFNKSLIVDLVQIPHILIAGATGQGKSVLLNVMVLSLLYKKHPSELKLVLIDPRIVELNLYSPVEKHFLAKLPNIEKAIISNISDAIRTLSSLCLEMDDRYALLADARVRNIKDYNNAFKKRCLNPRKGHKYLPYTLIIIDEYSDLIMSAGKEVELPLIRLTQKAHTVGIHVILSTQRPTKNIITGNLKANFSVQIALKVFSSLDSRIIIDRSGAESLSGRGNALYNDGINTTRIHIPYASTEDVANISSFIGQQHGYAHTYELPEYVSPYDNNVISSVDLNERDALFEESARLIVIHQSGSTSLIQRKFSIGYNRAGRLMDQMEDYGIVGSAQGSTPRDVLVKDEYSLEKLLSSLDQIN